MVAGAAFFIRLTRQPPLTPAATIGQSVAVGDLTVVVESAPETSGTLVVEIVAEGVNGDVVGDFRLIASGRRVDPEPNPCVASADRPVNCEVRFDVSNADGTSRVLFVERGDQQARWVLTE